MKHANKVLVPCSFQGAIKLPPSKSHTMRALLLGALSEGSCTVENPLNSPDVEAMLQAIKLLGAAIHRSPSAIQIEGVGGIPKRLQGSAIDVGNSGQVLRFMSACFAQATTPVFITGDASIRTQRPIKPLLQAINQLGGFARSLNMQGTAPLIVQGAIRGGYCRLDGQDSQPVSALLMTLPLAVNDSIVDVTNLGERPWVDFTLTWLDYLNISYTRSGDCFRIPGRQRIHPFQRKIPGDLSALAFPLLLGLITPSHITIEGVDLSDAQSDKKIVEVLESMGALFSYSAEEKTLSVQGPQRLIGRSIDVDLLIDAVPMLSVIGCFADGVTTLINGEMARKKESDRMVAMQAELQKMGAQIEVNGGEMRIFQSKLHGAELFSWHDHRVAMALACAAYAAKGASQLRSTECIAKSFPDFFEELARI